VILDAHEKVIFQSAAKLQGMSLSAWIKACVNKALEEQKKSRTPRSKEELMAFFRECDETEQGVEPDWDQHKRVIEGSAASGISDS
jgi:Fe-S cluster assembly ATPase SufC